MSIRIEDLAKTDFSQVTAPRAKRSGVSGAMEQKTGLSRRA
jgi:hypothetical protein